MTVIVTLLYTTARPPGVVHYVEADGVTTACGLRAEDCVGYIVLGDAASINCRECRAVLRAFRRHADAIEALSATEGDVEVMPPDDNVLDDDAIQVLDAFAHQWREGPGRVHRYNAVTGKTACGRRAADTPGRIFVDDDRAIDCKGCLSAWLRRGRW